MESDVTLVQEELVAIEIDDQLVLAEIRHCRPDADKFVSGARRLHQVSKDSQKADIGAYVGEMIEDLERRVLAGEELASRMLALEALDRIVEKSHGNHSAQPLPQPRVLVLPGEPEPPPGPIKLPALTGVPYVEEPAKSSSLRIPLALAAALILAAGLSFKIMERGVVAKTPAIAAPKRVQAEPAVAEVPVPAPVAAPVAAPEKRRRPSQYQSRYLLKPRPFPRLPWPQPWSLPRQFRIL